MSMNRSRSYYEILLVLEVANNKLKEMKKCFVFLHLLREREKEREIDLISLLSSQIYRDCLVELRYLDYLYSE